jgi:hypothetical protein
LRYLLPEIGHTQAAFPFTTPVLDMNFGFDLTINRIGALAGASIRTTDESGRMCDNKIIGTFRDQAHKLQKNPIYNTAYDDLLSVLSRDSGAPEPLRFLQGPFARGGGPEEIEVTTMPLDPNEAAYTDRSGQPPIVALFPSRRIACEVEGMPWVIRTRASITACALQQSEGLAKLWWTFEGVPRPSDPETRPSEKQAAAFLMVTQRMAEAAVPPLRTAFRESLHQAAEVPIGEFDTRSEGIRISMADTTDQPVGALFDALYFADRPLSDIRAGRKELRDAHAGLRLFETFVFDVTRLPVDDSKISTTDRTPGANGILFTEHNRPVLTVAGLARRAGPSIDPDFLTSGQRKRQKEETYVRATSAARPITARLASEQAIVLEQRAKLRLKAGELALS